MLAEQDNMGELLAQRCAQLLGHIFAEVVWVAGWVDAVVGGRHREHATRRKDAGELGDDLVLACNVLDDLKAHHQIESTVVEWQGVDVASHELKRGVRDARGRNRLLGNVGAYRLSRTGRGQHGRAVADATPGVEHTALRGQPARPPVAGEVLGLHELPSRLAWHEALHRLADSVREIRVHRPDGSGPRVAPSSPSAHPARPVQHQCLGPSAAVYDRVR